MANNIDLTISALECPLGTFQCSGRLIFRLRTEPALRAAPVFRMAYSAPTAHCAVSSETLMLQVRFAHPPNCAPSSRLFSISHRSGLMAPLCKGSCPPQRTEGLSPWGRGQGEGARRPLPQSPHRTGSSSCSGVPVGLFGKPKRTTFSRFAASIEARCAVSSETLMLQPLRGLRTPRRSPVSSPLAAAAD